MQLNFSTKKITLFLLGTIIGLLMLHFILHYIALVIGYNPIETIPNRFNVDNEVSIPTWFSQSLLLLAAALLALIAASAFKYKEIYAYHWSFLSAIFVYLSIDEGTMLHEASILRARKLFGLEETPGLLSNAWVLLAVPVVAVLAIILWRFIFSLPQKIRILFFVSAFLYLMGVFSVEIFGSRYAGFKYMVAVMLEEGLEMIGVSVFIYALLRYIRENLAKIEIRVT